MHSPDASADWQGTLKEAMAQATLLIEANRLPLELPPERTVRDWRTEGVLSKIGRRFTRRNVVEILRAKQLRDQDLPVVLIREYLQARSDVELLNELQSVPAAALTSDLLSKTPANLIDADVKGTVLFLGYAILKQFREVQKGALVGIYQNIPLEIRQAQARLARIAMMNGEEDHFASVHELLHACTRPMSEWAPGPIAQHPEYGEMVLIDPEMFVPSDDCEKLAEEGGHLEDLIETQLHGMLMDALNRLELEQRDEVYTLIRGFIAERPMASFDELQGLKRNPRIQGEPELIAFLNQVYIPAHAHDAARKLVPRCRHCNGPLRDGHCRLASCRFLHQPSVPGDSLPVDDALIARPEILRFWCDPAQEELRVYQALAAVHGAAVSLYPQTDACDIGLGTAIGVDVKDYRDPERLARKLNESIGRLTLYPRKILAVATRRARESSYLPRLTEHLSPSLRKRLEVMSVDDAIKTLSALELPHV